MIVGMIPMAIGGPGEEQNAALARARHRRPVVSRHRQTLLIVAPTCLPCCAGANDGKPHHWRIRGSLGNDRDSYAAKKMKVSRTGLILKTDRVCHATEALRPSGRGYGGTLFGASALLLLACSLALGGLAPLPGRARKSRLPSKEKPHPSFPTFGVAAVRAKRQQKLPSPCQRRRRAFEAANIFCAHQMATSKKRYVDNRRSGSRAGALLAEITAPELDHQITASQGRRWPKSRATFAANTGKS